MKTFILLLISFSCLAQDVEIYQDGYLLDKVQSTSFDLNEKKVSLTTKDYTLELFLIKKESKSKWICSDKNGAKYIITAKVIAGNTVVIFEPESKGLYKFILYIEQ